MLSSIPDLKTLPPTQIEWISSNFAKQYWSIEFPENRHQGPNKSTKLSIKNHTAHEILINHKIPFYFMFCMIQNYKTHSPVFYQFFNTVRVLKLMDNNKMYALACFVSFMGEFGEIYRNLLIKAFKSCTLWIYFEWLNFMFIYLPWLNDYNRINKKDYGISTFLDNTVMIFIVPQNSWGRNFNTLHK